MLEPYERCSTPAGVGTALKRARDILGECGICKLVVSSMVFISLCAYCIFVKVEVARRMLFIPLRMLWHRGLQLVFYLSWHCIFANVDCEPHAWYTFAHAVAFVGICTIVENIQRDFYAQI